MNSDEAAMVLPEGWGAVLHRWEMYATPHEHREGWALIYGAEGDFRVAVPTAVGADALRELLSYGDIRFGAGRRTGGDEARAQMRAALGL